MEALLFKVHGMFYKPEIRKPIVSRRKQLPPAAIKELSEQIAARAFPLAQLIESEHVGSYISHDGEVDPMPILRSEISTQKFFYLPVITSESEKNLAFYPYSPGEDLPPNRYGIPEPQFENKKSIPIEKLEVVFVPIVAFDKYCNRLGRGAGYYDHTFSFIKNLPPNQKRPLLVGLAYEFQKVAKIEPSKWDVPMDIIITELDIYLKI